MTLSELLGYDSRFPIYEDIIIYKVQYLKQSEMVKVVLKHKITLDDPMKDNICNLIKGKLRDLGTMDILWYKDVEHVDLEDVVGEYWIDVINSLASSFPSAKTSLLKAVKNIEGNKINIGISNEFISKMLCHKNIDRLIQTQIYNMFNIRVEIKIYYDESAIEEDYILEKQIEEKRIVSDIIANRPKVSSKASDKPKEKVKDAKGDKKASPWKENYRKSKEPLDDNVVYGNRNINEETTEMSELNMGSGRVAVAGDIFKVNVFEAKSGKIYPSLYITDYSGSITIKIYPRNNDEVEKLLEELKPGVCCKVYGEVEIDRFSKDLVLNAKSIVKLKPNERMDGSEVKRVELHAHTTMSSMDGIVPPSKLIAKAAKWGHKAIAITDHGVAQAFPEAMDAGKKHNIKIIYGLEGYLVNDGVGIATGCRGIDFNSTFVVFDIETTGFSSEQDRIIEIGAVKIENGQVIDRFNELINPKISIPYKITELTSISNDMVKDCKTIEDVLPRFLDFVGDSVVVAHNAEFDTGFIKSKCRNLGLKFKNGIIDTLPLARFLFPQLKKHKLNVICDYLKISLENHHRAVDDAKATGDILLKCFDMLKEKDLNSLDQINKEYLKSFDIKKAPTYHVIILAKNQIGLKNLYKLISFSNLDYYQRRPRLPKSLIEEYREGLIIGSACEAGEVFKGVLAGKSMEDMEHIVDFYDYLEVQPIGNNEFLIKKNMVKDEYGLRELNKKVCELGEFYNKKVVATGDVHFLEPRDEVFRRILMAGKGFDDADNQPPLYFKTTTEMLREFSYLGEKKSMEIVVENPEYIQSLVEEVKPIPDETYAPKIEGAEDEIRNMTLNKVRSIYGDNLPEVIQKRLDKELNSIINNGYAVLYLIAQKLVAKSISDGYLVGSRGSVGSSFVATMSDITEVNGLPPHYVCPNCKHSEFILDGSIGSGVDLPDKNCEKCGTPYKKDGHDIPFETFLGFEGDKEPDIDLNFSGDNQGDIHRYTEVLFGKGHTFKAGTIGTIADKTAYGYVKKYLDERNINTTNAEIERLTLGCTGVKRTSGQHPGGIMVVPSDNEIFNFCPIQHPADDPSSDIITTHFDYHSISGRLLKLDILGHDDPTMLRMLQDLTGVSPQSVPLSDPKVLSLFTGTEGLGITPEELGCEVGCYGIPEFGTKFVRQMLLDTKPQTFSDLVRISGLSHGTDVWLNNAQYYIKEGYTTLKDCISTRDDIMVYLIYKGLPPKTAFTIMEKVRKGKGVSEEFEAIMREHNVPDWYIESCKRIKYMFPKGHAVAYVMMAMRIAYFKVYYPKAYYATYFTVRADDFDGDLVVKGEEAIKDTMDELNALGNNIGTKEKGLLTTLELCYEMYKRDIKFLPVDLYKSEAVKFTIEGDNIRIPLSGLTGVGENAAKAIVEVRDDGEFISKEDLRIRSKATKTVVEALANHGAMEGLPETNQLSLF
ncbi:PolC-type DNA polymerase III [Clostridium sp. UBA1056]|uniref:PolC-type DNA polymerase III n=1 Tax=unclassified Clostridium TaxID=2614128 RepID=UPI0032164E84